MWNLSTSHTFISLYTLSYIYLPTEKKITQAICRYTYLHKSKRYRLGGNGGKSDQIQNKNYEPIFIRYIHRYIIPTTIFDEGCLSYFVGNKNDLEITELI